MVLETETFANVGAAPGCKCFSRTTRTGERRTHDCAQHGTTSVFAALNAATGDVIGRCCKCHRANEFKCFLSEIGRQVSVDLDIHIVMGNYATHKTRHILAL